MLQQLKFFSYNLKVIISIDKNLFLQNKNILSILFTGNKLTNTINKAFHRNCIILFLILENEFNYEELIFTII